jgi:hypothetical protein
MCTNSAKTCSKTVPSKITPKRHKSQDETHKVFLSVHLNQIDFDQVQTIFIRLVKLIFHVLLGSNISLDEIVAMRSPTHCCDYHIQECSMRLPLLFVNPYSLPIKNFLERFFPSLYLSVAFVISWLLGSLTYPLFITPTISQLVRKQSHYY